MRHVLRLLVVSLVFCVGVSAVSGGAQQDFEGYEVEQRRSLRGLIGVYVVVESIDSDAERAGLRK